MSNTNVRPGPPPEIVRSTTPGIKIIISYTLNMPNESFILVDFQLPNHSNELSKAEEVIQKLKKRFEIVQMQRTINDCTHTEMFEQIVRCLLYVAKLSEPAFEIEDQLEALYTKNFKHCPALGKTLWLQHYDEIHHPYSILKNRCYRLLELLDEEYFKRHGKNPPNFNI